MQYLDISLVKMKQAKDALLWLSVMKYLRLSIGFDITEVQVSQEFADVAWFKVRCLYSFDLHGH